MQSHTLQHVPCHVLSLISLFSLSKFLRGLKNKSFVFQKRGEIEVKGKGRMTTYFLERNTGVSEQQIMGVSDRETGAGQKDSQKSQEPAFHRAGLFAVLLFTLHSLNFRARTFN